LLLHCRLGYVYGIASPRALVAKVSGWGWVTAPHLTAFL